MKKLEIYSPTFLKTNGSHLLNSLHKNGVEAYYEDNYLVFDENALKDVKLCDYTMIMWSNRNWLLGA